MTSEKLSFMRRAIKIAEECRGNGEVAVGAVIVKGGKIIGEGANSREKSKNALDHAELLAIRNACETIGDWRLNECEMFVTLEPCPMCAGAILMSRIGALTFGAYSPEGAVISKMSLFDEYKSPIRVTGGVLAEECGKLLKIE